MTSTGGIMKNLLAAAAVAALATGCASTAGGLEQPQYAATFTVDQPYQLTLKNIQAGDQECRPFQLVPIGQQIDDVQNYPDLREAKIIQGASGIGRQIYDVITIKEVDGKSVVTHYRKGDRARRNVSARTERWAKGSTSCDI
jgi:hypothetical protein